MGEQSNYEHSDDAPVGQWGMKYGSNAPRVTLYERDERGSENQPALYARWYVNGARVGPYRVKQVSTIRDNKGDVEMEKRQDAEQEAKRIWKAVQDGTPPEEIFSEDDVGEPGEARTPKDELTLGEGLDLFMDEEEGRYAGETDQMWYDDQLRRAERLKGLLGRDVRWTSLVPAKIKTLWVRLYEHYEDTETTGRRESIRTVQLLGTARRWLVANRYLVESAPELKEGWRNDLKDYWEKQADEELTVSRPSHDEDELRLIAAAVRDPAYDIDPRFRALLRMGLGQRLGPVGTRALRSNLELDDSGRWELGQLTIPSRPGKQGVRIDLSEELRKMWETILADGYLESLEDAYRADEIDDFHLLPGGRLVQGTAPVENGDESVRKPWLHTQLRDLERQIYQRHEDLDLWSEQQREAGTMHIRGRGWHGIRRGMVEFLDDQDVSPSVRNAMLGWVPGSRTPELVYKSRDSEKRYQRAAETREEVTEDLGASLSTSEVGEDRTRAEVRADLEEAMEADDMERVRKLMDELDAIEGEG